MNLPHRKLNLGTKRSLPKRKLMLPGRGKVDPRTFEQQLAESNATLPEEADGAPQAGGETMWDRMKRNRLELDQEINASFYACLVFQSQAQRDAFFAQLGVKGALDYVDGVKLAASLKLKLPAALPWKKVAPDPKLAALALPVVKR